jgi:hypothetical protein
MGFKSNDVILLTGAGFTHNFGGFLAREMWAMIFNNPLVQNQERIRKLLLKNFDFESVYSEVTVKNKYLKDEEKAIREAVEQAYQKLDYVLENPVHIDGISWENTLSILLTDILFISLPNFRDEQDDEKRIFFTLNQDLLIERNLDSLFHRPGINPTYTNSSPIVLPQDCHVDKLKDEIASNNIKIIYIKLHGSYDWFSRLGNAKVIGKNKPEYIEQEPLLKCYFQLFQDVINEGNKRLLIIGYSFRDEHINKVLQNGVRNHDLRLYVVDPLDPQEFKQRLFKNTCYAMNLWSATHGYCPYTLKQIYSIGRISFDQICRMLDLIK